LFLREPVGWALAQPTAALQGGSTSENMMHYAKVAIRTIRARRHFKRTGRGATAICIWGTLLMYGYCVDGAWDRD
jgi:hypothetical protein